MVSGIVGREQLIGMGRVANHGVKIDNRIEVALGAYPLIDLLTVSLVGRGGVVVA